MKLTKFDAVLLFAVGFLVGFALTSRAEPAQYTAHFTWSIPTTRADGSPLAVSELQGYEIYWTCGPANSGKISVPGGNRTSIDLEAGWIGTCDFAMAAIDTNGVKSALSPMVTLTFKPDKPAEGGFD